MKTILFFILLVLSIQLTYSQLQSDTLKNLDSTSHFTFDDVPNIVVVTYEQVDTNGTAAGGYPDSVQAYARIGNGMWAEVDFRTSSGDSNFQVVSLSAAQKLTHTIGQIRIGWLWAPGATDVYFV